MPATRKSERNDDYADPYEEEKTEVDPDKIPVDQFRHGTYDITYSSKFGGSKTIRAINATGPIGERQKEAFPDDCVTFHDDGDRYAYVPGERRLLSLNGDSPVTVAEGDDIRRIERVQYPPGAPLIGAPQTGVTATVFYRSKRSGNMVSVDMRVEREESTFWRMSGTRVSDGKHIEVECRAERNVTVRHYGKTGTLNLGKTARVEFPLGHSYTVDVHGLTDEKADEYVERIKKAVDGAYRYHDVDTEVTHDGRIGE